METALRCISPTQHQQRPRGNKVELQTLNKRCLGGNPRKKIGLFVSFFCLFNLHMHFPVLSHACTGLLVFVDCRELERR